MVPLCSSTAFLTMTVPGLFLRSRHLKRGGSSRTTAASLLPECRYRCLAHDANRSSTRSSDSFTTLPGGILDCIREQVVQYVPQQVFIQFAVSRSKRSSSTSSWCLPSQCGIPHHLAAELGQGDPRRRNCSLPDSARPKVRTSSSRLRMRLVASSMPVQQVQLFAVVELVRIEPEQLGEERIVRAGYEIRARRSIRTGSHFVEFLLRCRRRAVRARRSCAA